MATTLRPLEPNRSALHFFGAELRHRRITAELSLAALAGQVFVTADMLGKIEAAMRFPSLDLAQRSDIVLDAAGALTRLRGFAVAERERHRQVTQAGSAGLGPAETTQLRHLLTVINLVAASAAESTPAGDVLGRIDELLSANDAAPHHPGSAPLSRPAR